MERDGYFADAGLHERGFDDHFYRKLHPRAPHVELLVEISTKPAKAAVDIMNGDVKPVARQKGKKRVA